MKEKQEYENPKLKFVLLDPFDIITTSDGNSDNWNDTTDSDGWI